MASSYSSTKLILIEQRIADEHEIKIRFIDVHNDQNSLALFYGGTKPLL